MVQRRLKNARTDDGSKVKVGHAGTLDPLAEGVLVLGVGRAVRLVPYVQQQPKHYRAKFLIGQSSVSGDLEDDVQLHPEFPVPTIAQLESVARSMIGSIQQTPPAHSAIWIDGKRAHQRVRDGEQVEMPSRTVEIHSIELLRYNFPELEADIVCGSGTYIRTVGLDWATAAGSTAVMAHLRRDAIGRFVHTQAVSIEQLREDDLESLLLPPSMAVSQMTQITLTTDQSVRLGHGLAIELNDENTGPEQNLGSLANGDNASVDGTATNQEAAAMTADGQIRGIVVRKEGAWFPKRIFPVQDVLH